MRSSWAYLLIDVYCSHNSKYLWILDFEISELLADIMTSIVMIPKLLFLENSIKSNVL